MLNHLTPAERRLYVILCANFAVLGISMTIIGATVPQIIAGFHWSYVETGMVMAGGSVGYLLSTFASGPLLKRVPERILVAVGLGLTALALCFLVRSPLFWVNVILNVVSGIGQGFSEVVTNTLVIRLEKKGESRLMNLMHAFYCVGAVVGPLIVGLLAWLGVGFVTVFVFAGVVQAVVALLLMLQSYPKLGAGEIPVEPAVPGELEAAAPDAGGGSGLPASAGLGRLLRSPLLLVSALTLFFYVGVELAMSNWIAEYFVRFRQAGAGAAALMVSVYWLGLLAGRLGLSFFYKGKRQEYMLALLAGTSVLWFVSVILSPDVALAIVAAFLTGLSFSGIYPIVMSLVGVWFKGSPTAVGMVATAGGGGLLLFPLGIGALAQSIGLAMALLASAVFALALALIAFGFMGRRWRQESLARR